MIKDPNQKKSKADRTGNPKLWGLVRNWAHQSFFYLDRTERLARIVFEIVPMGIIVFAIVTLTDIAPTSIFLWAASFLFIHTLHWVFNNNWRVCVLFALPWLRNRGAEATCYYLNSLSQRLSRDAWIAGAMVFGSLSRGEWHDRSDLDVRILRRSGFLNGVLAVRTMMRERIIAVIAGQPLDVYLADGVPFLDKMRKDEIPIFLVKRSHELERRYPNIPVHTFHISDFGSSY